MNILKKDLGEAGIKYVRTRLEAGGALSKAFLQMWSIDDVFTALPSRTPQNQVLDFEHGGVCTQSESVKWVSAYLGNKLPNQQRRSLLMEDSWAKPRDSAIYDKKHRLMISGQTVIYGLSGYEFHEEDITRLYRSLASFHYIGFVSAANLPEINKIPFQLADSFILKFIQNISVVFVSAYDREGILISDIQSANHSRV